MELVSKRQVKKSKKGLWGLIIGAAAGAATVFFSKKENRDKAKEVAAEAKEQATKLKKELEEDTKKVVEKAAQDAQKKIKKAVCQDKDKKNT